jgi:hypothetical protein
MPWASTTRWRFVPCLPRSVGFLPVSWPPRGRHRGGVQRGPVPVDAIGLGQLFEKHLVQPAPDARLVPVSQPAPARHPAPTPHLGRQVLPGDARLQHEQDPRQRRPVRHPGPSALGLRRLRREQRRDPRPQRIRQQFLRHGTLLHGSYSASLAAYATVLLGVLRARCGSPAAGYGQSGRLDFVVEHKSWGDRRGSNPRPSLEPLSVEPCCGPSPDVAETDYLS